MYLQLHLKTPQKQMEHPYQHQKTFLVHAWIYGPINRIDPAICRQFPYSKMFSISKPNNPSY